MTFVNESINQFKTTGPILAVVYIILLSVLISIAIISIKFDITVDLFTRDPAALFDASPFIGVISNIGILFWCSTATVCFFSSTLQVTHGSKIVAKFLIYSGLLTSLLLFDDLFMLHETVFPDILHIPEKVVYLVYLVLVISYFIKFRDSILQTEYVVLFLACTFFGLSVISDVLLPQEGMEFLIEDGFKLFGIVTWFIYFSRTCYKVMRNK